MIALQLFFLLVSSDFPISIADDDQYSPVVTYANYQYYVCWIDHRLYPPDKSVFGARVATSGEVLDPEGKFIFVGKTISFDFSRDETNLLVVLQDGC
jgi:hypothetical protein